MKRYKIIFNPAARAGAARRALPRLKNLLDQAGLRYDIVITEYSRHAESLAKDAASAGYDVVVAAGGDGTANEVINGLMAAKADSADISALGILCIGRGNDFAFGIDVPIDLEEGCKALKEDHRRVIDLGWVIGGIVPEGRYFGNCVGVGFDAIGTIEASKLPKMGGFLNYFIAVLKTIFLYYKAPLSTVEYGENTISQPSLLISIMNGQRLGGGFWMAPESSPEDGYFDLCIAHEVSRRRMFRLIPEFIKGTQASQPEVKTGRASRVIIQAHEGTLPTQMDGEIISIDGERLEIKILPKELSVVCKAPESKA
ncbi:MAG: YegS/Rv2252/BmrU family lipid kinase [Anaerolineales bacterium]|nr:YegS/Rv2252/BmrU family lipid kinase [Anaerolineales bacterium]